ncbi:MAG TPA: dihydroorotase [Bacteroidetes bacterium]|nr:dihydroorotase [Bacteroidota bacterium]
MKTTLIRNATMINEGLIKKADVLIQGDKIVRVSEPGLEKGDANIIDAEGKWLIPGVIDDHVHFRDPGFPEKADFYSESVAAVAGGVTSVMDMPNTKPQTITCELLDEKLELVSGKSLTNFALYFGATNNNMDEIRKLDTSKVCGIKVFTGSSTGNMLVDDPESLRRIFAEAPVLVAVHAEDDSLIREKLERYEKEFGINIPFVLHPDIRSEEACYRSSTKAVELARIYGTRLHVLHLSTAREMALFDNTVPAREKKITAEVCVHHLWFDEADYMKYGTRIKWNPAIKTKEDKEGLWDAMLDNRIDVIATDHAPHTWLEKARPYLLAPSGGPLVQHSLVAMLEMVHQGKISLEKVVGKMCHTPADIFSIPDRGYIRTGYQADLVLIDPNYPWVVGKDNILYKCGWSPFEGTRFTSRVTHTIINGHLVYENGEIDRDYRGKQLTFLR